MFTIYKKIISPETSPVLGPATPRESASAQSSSAQSSSAQSSSAQSSSIDIQSPKMQSMMPPVQSMETFLLCDCCSTRTKQPLGPAQPAQPEKKDPAPIFEFDHATHYTYNATTPRMVWEFDINVKPKH